MKRCGFISLSSSILSSESEVCDDYGERLGPLSVNIANNSHMITAKASQHSQFSFNSPPKRRFVSGTEDLENFLLQPVKPKNDHIADFGEHDNVLMLGDRLQNNIGSVSSSETCRDEESRGIHVNVTNGLDQFFGSFNGVYTPQVSSWVKPSQGLRTKKVVPMHELVDALGSKTLSSMRIKVLSKQPIPDPLTPNFSKKIAAKAKESKDNSKYERRTYAQFLKRLCAEDRVIAHEDEQEVDDFDDDDDDDEIYEILTATGDSDDGQGDAVLDAPRAIPNKELFDLFSDEISSETTITASVLFPPEKPASFDSIILQKIEKHANLHFQLLVQNLALSGEIKEADQVWVTVLKLMIRFNDHFEGLGDDFPIEFSGSQGLSLLLRILRQSPLHESLLNQIRRTTNDNDLRLKATVKTVPFRLKHREGKIASFSRSFWHILSIFGKPFDPGYAIIPRNTDLHQIHLVDHQKIMQESSFLQGRRIDSFLAVEDRLLLLGLCRYGLGNWEKIQSNLLPTRNARQLSVRYKNLTARRAPSNPIKSFAEEVMKPLSKTEEELLRQGVRTYGDDWASISTRFLPHRPSAVLKRLWLKCQESAQTIKGSFFDIYFPTDDENDSDYIDSL